MTRKGRAQQEAAADESTVTARDPALADDPDQILEEVSGIGVATDTSAPMGDPGDLSAFGRSAGIPDDLDLDEGRGGPVDPGTDLGSTLLDDLAGDLAGPNDGLDSTSDGSGPGVLDDQTGWKMDGGGDGLGHLQDRPPLGSQGETTRGETTAADAWLGEIAEDFPGSFNYVSDYDHFTQPGADDPPVGSWVDSENDPLSSGFVWGSDYGHVHDPQAHETQPDEQGGDGDDPGYQTEHGQGGGSASQNPDPPGELIGWDDMDDEDERESQTKSSDDDDDDEGERQGGGGSGDAPGSQSMPAPDDGTGGDPDADDFIGGRGDVDPPREAEEHRGGDLIGGRGDVDPAPEAEDAGGSGGLDMEALGLGAVDPLGNESSLLGGDTGDLAEMIAEADLGGDIEIELDVSVVDADIGEDV